ncbi:MAG: methyltransferase [Treponema sp.]|nr:methyltransferase [Treponema sp.]
MSFRFALSQGLFSSSGVDRGSQLLLKALSRTWDADRTAGCSPPRRILDCGCGAGIIGVCAAALALPAAPDLRVRAQDRDELARVFTGYNAQINGIPPVVLEAHTEALLSGPPGAAWDLILSNIPAKAGKPVLEDFIARSLGLLDSGGKVLLVVVHTLEDFFRSRISQAGGMILREEAGSEHIVFVYARGGTEGPEGTETSRRTGPVQMGDDFLASNPFYRRHELDYDLNGIPLHIDTIHGAPGFDRPGEAVETAVKLARRLGLAARIAPGTPVLVHEPEQGWFAAWFFTVLEQGGDNSGRPLTQWVLSGRNILSLEAARHNLRAVLKNRGPAGTRGFMPEPAVIPAVSFDREKLQTAAELPGSGESPEGFGFIAAFPEPVPRVDENSASWEGLSALLRPGGIVLAAFPSSEAERFDRKKPSRFIRLGDLRRNGFRALAYQYQGKAAVLMAD